MDGTTVQEVRPAPEVVEAESNCEVQISKKGMTLGPFNQSLQEAHATVTARPVDSKKDISRKIMTYNRTTN